MRILVQEVLSASVKIDGQTVGSIGRGLLLFVGFTDGDDEDTMKRMLEKTLSLRIFPDVTGKTNLSLADVKDASVLCISQFTLYADCRHGRRPSFSKALGGEKSEPLYERFKALLLASVPSAQFGRFGADMKVGLVNDGPFTIFLDSKELFE